MGCAESKEEDEWKNKEPLTVFPPNPRCPPPKEEPKEPRRESLQLTVFPANPKEAGSKGPAKESKEPRAPAQLSVFPVNPVVAAAREKALQEQNGSQGLAGLATAVVQGITSAFTTSKEEPLQTTSGALPLEDNPNGIARPDSPETYRVTQRALNKGTPEDGIVTVWEGEDDPHSPHAASTSSEPRARAALGRAHGIWQSSNGSEGSLPGTCYSAVDSSEEDSRGSTLLWGASARQDSTKARQAALVTISAGSTPHANTNTPPPPQNRASFNANREGPLGTTSRRSLEESLALLDPATHLAGGVAGAGAAGSVAGGSVASGGAASKGGRFPPLSEMILDLSDDDSEVDLDATLAGFSMQRWKRFYTWNKTKHRELLRFLWKRFDPETWSVYCMTYRNQDALIEPFQGENIIHGVACRMEHLMSDSRPLGPSKLSIADQLFSVFTTLTDKATGCHKVVGVVIAHGKTDIPYCLYGLHELGYDWSVMPADVNDPLVRTFVSNLLTGQPPSAQYEVCSKREVM